MRRVHAVILALLGIFLFGLSACISRNEAHHQQELAAVDDQAYTVTFYQQGTVLARETVKAGDRVVSVPRGYSWRDETGAEVNPALVSVDRDMSYYVWSDIALLSEHVRYMEGEGELFRPEDPVTRGQAARILCSLLDMDSIGQVSGDRTFTDVPQGSEYYDSVMTLAGLGLMNGYSDGSFRPEADITRSELLAVLCRMNGVAEVTALSFPDVAQEHWALGVAAAGMSEGWAKGYEDGQFYPDLPVTRAETVVMINRATGRTPDRDTIDLVCRTSPYIDVSRRYWAYYDIVDVSYTSDLMAYILGEAEGMQPGFMFIGEDMCHVNPENLRLDYYQAGFHTIQDGLPTDGLYYVPNDGYIIQRFKAGLLELDGSMFYVKADDGPFATDFWLQELYFGNNGRYTSGDDVLDAYVDAIMAPIIQGDTANLLREDKLREAYDSILYGDYHYMARPTGWVRGSNIWTQECARVMFQTKRGSCFYWAGAFMYLARRLGYQAYPICGGVNNNNALHAWVMIDEDGVEYIYDVELDWGYSTGGDGRYRRRSCGSLFKQPRNDAKLIYIFPGETYIAPPMDDDDVHELDPGIVWPSEPYTSAYIVVDGVTQFLDTVWSEIVDESGALLGYTVTVTYNGTVYTNNVQMQGPPAEQTPAPPTTDPPSWTEPPGPTEEPPATIEPGPTDEPPATVEPGPTDAPPVTTDEPIVDVPDPPVEPDPVVPEQPTE